MLTEDSEQGAPLLDSAEEGSTAGDPLPYAEKDGDYGSEGGTKDLLTRRRVLIMAITLVVFLMLPITFLVVIPAEVEAECKETKIELLEVSEFPEQ